MDPAWIQPGSSLDPAWIQPGSSLDPAWIQPGSRLVPGWIRPGSDGVGKKISQKTFHRSFHQTFHAKSFTLRVHPQGEGYAQWCLSMGTDPIIEEPSIEPVAEVAAFNCGMEGECAVEGCHERIAAQDSSDTEGDYAEEEEELVGLEEEVEQFCLFSTVFHV